MQLQEFRDKIQTLEGDNQALLKRIEENEREVAERNRKWLEQKESVDLRMIAVIIFISFVFNIMIEYLL